MELIVSQLQPGNVISMNMSVCNNASWAAGELAIRSLPDALRPFVGPLAQCFIQILEMRMVNRALGENAAISLGRLGMVCPEELQSGLAHFITSWCAALRRLRDGIEKEHGFAGLCKLIQMNPSGVTGGLSAFVEAIASWRGCRNEELVSTMGQLVVGYKEHVGEQQWAMVMRDLEPGVVRKLAETYNV